MNTTILLNLFLLVAAAVPPAFSQSLVQVSSISVNPKTLDCAQHLTAAVDVQVYFTGIKITEPAVVVRLSVYSTDPPGNTLDRGEQDKEITLRESPGTARFAIACGNQTFPGKIKLAAVISRVPTGVQIARSDYVAEVTIERPK